MSSPCLLSFFDLEVQKEEVFFAFSEKKENFSVFLGIILRGEAPLRVTRLEPPSSSVPSIFFGSPKQSGVLAWQRVREESSFPPKKASLESKEGWPGGLLKDRVGP